jgi:hypothetical protein
VRRPSLEPEVACARPRLRANPGSDGRAARPMRSDAEFRGWPERHDDERADNRPPSTHCWRPRPEPALDTREGERIGGHGSARGSLDAFIFATEPLASSAAAATSSGNSASALSSPARRASSSTIAFSMILALSTQSTPTRDCLRRRATSPGVLPLREPGSMLSSAIGSRIM